MVQIAPALAVLMAAPASEIEFNCPWCNTRLALTRADFDRERAVLCPRCSNPIDLDIQRRLARTATPKPQPPIAPTRRQVTTPAPAPTASTRVEKAPASTRYSATPATADSGGPTASAPRYTGTPEPPLNVSTQAPNTQPTIATYTPGSALPSTETVGAGKGLSDWAKPLDIDASFHTAPRPGPTAAGKSDSKLGASNLYGGKIRCEACGYENAKVPPEFSFGTVPKCAWCGKPLPP